LPDAREAIGAMLKSQESADDLQREYIKEASERICKCLKEDFAPFLPSLLPGMFKAMKVEGIAAEVNDGGDETQYIMLDVGGGKTVKVHTSKFEECTQAVQMLHTFAEEMGAAFFSYIQDSAQALLPLLTDDDAMSACNEEARGAAMQAWGLLIKSAKEAAAAKGETANLAQQLLATILQKVVPNMQADEDCETVGDAADGIGICLRNAGLGSLVGNDVLSLVRQLFNFIDASFARTSAAEKEKKADSEGAPPELQQGDDEDDDEDDEASCRTRLEDAIGAVMEVAPQDFLACLQECGDRMRQWLASKDNRTLALFLAADLLKHLKDASNPSWPVFMPSVIQCLTDEDSEVRTPASYCINLGVSARIRRGSTEML